MKTLLAALLVIGVPFAATSGVLYAKYPNGAPDNVLHPHLYYQCGDYDVPQGDECPRWAQQ
jgi:hypothetical protein